MKYFLSLLILISFLLIPLNSSSQNLDETPSKNVVHVSMGTFVLVYSAQLNFDRHFATAPTGFFKSYYLSGKLGRHAYLDFGGSRSGTGTLMSLGVTGLTGKGKNHFETAFGLGYFVETERLDGDNQKTLFPSFALGYRRQGQKGFIFRTGLGLAEYFYVGFGYSF